MDAQCISNTTRVCLKAMEKHFFLLHVDWIMTRHTLIKKLADSTHTDSKNQKSNNSKINEKTSMNQV